MNIVKFDDCFNNIAEGVAYANFSLKYKNSFPEEIRKKFDEALRKLSDLLKKDQAHMNQPQKMWQTAHRIVQLDKLYLKICKIRDKILDLPPPQYFSRRLKEEVLPDLNSRINELTRFIASTNRLPFKVGYDREIFYENARKKIEFVDASKLTTAEKEYFHFLGNQLDEEKLKKINTDFYDGSLEIYSLLSWSKILEAFIKEGDKSERLIGKALLKMVNGAIPIANKRSFAAFFPNRKELDKINAEILYFEKLASAYKENATFSHDYKAISKEEFAKKYILQEPCSIPLIVMGNELAWDIVDRINKMEESDSQIFLLGSTTHIVTVRISCFEKAHSRDPGIYRYEIFNTGSGTSKFHHVEDRENNRWACPLVFNNVPKKILAYPFFAELIRHALIGENMEDFYKLHDDFLVEEGRALKEKESGSWYMIQKYGICAYTAVEAWISSYLNSKQIKHLEVIKAQYSTKKQKQVVLILDSDLKEESTWKTAGREAKHLAKQVLTTKSQKLEESRILLQLGEEHLQGLLKTSSN